VTNEKVKLVSECVKALSRMSHWLEEPID
jgi:hypothetical protein